MTARERYNLAWRTARIYTRRSYHPAKLQALFIRDIGYSGILSHTRAAEIWNQLKNRS